VTATGTGVLAEAGVLGGVRGARVWWTRGRTGVLRAGADVIAERVLSAVPAVTTPRRTLCFACARETVCTGPSRAATTSPATSLSAGATPEERTEAAPPGSRSTDREIDAAASAAGGKKLVADACSFILGAPTAANEEAVRTC
jgi:hypothetical protein